MEIPHKGAKAQRGKEMLWLSLPVCTSLCLCAFALHYQLTSSKGIRKGALLRLTFEDGLTGYADCHPWPELGDKSLDDQLSLLKQGIWTTLTHQSCRFARLDAEARAAGVNLLEGLPIPPSHYLVQNLAELTTKGIGLIEKEGFSHLKVKVGREIVNDSLPLMCLMTESGLQWRLDFNGCLSEAECRTFLKKIMPYSQQIDFIEDPFPYDPAAWRAIQSDYPISLACDRMALEAIGNPQAARVLILKPAIQSEEPFLLGCRGQRLIVTSYLDHPLGQTTAAYIAAKLKLPDICGLLSHRVYLSTPFSSSLSQEGPLFHTVGGTGFGFDELLKNGCN